MNIKKIQELVELMNGNDLAEIEIENEGTKIRLIKRGQGIVEEVVSSAPVTVKETPVQKAAQGSEKLEGNLKEVKSPMVGTFYRSSSPDADVYVEVGDLIKKGDVLCIVEAMKLMNEVKAEFGGKIVEIPAENAEPVEFGQTMFIVEPS